MRNRWMVSVLTPVHHTPISLLERAFSSLRDQSVGFENIQWVVLLHNCTDDYARQAVKLLDGYPNIFSSRSSLCKTDTELASPVNILLCGILKAKTKSRYPDIIETANIISI